MTGAELSEDIRDPALSLASARCLGLLVGAGASIGAGLPGWDQLSRRLLVGSGAISSDTAAEQFLARQDPALAAEAAKSAAGDRWAILVREALYQGQKPTPAALHRAVAALARRFIAINREIGIFTLNFDLLLEEALVHEAPGGAAFIRTSDIPRADKSEVEVHHLHGAISPEDEDLGSFVLTLSDFTSLGQEPAPWQRSAIQEYLQKGPLVLVGTTYRDSDVRQWLHDLKKTDGNDVFILLSRAALEVSRAEFRIIQDALAEQWRAIGVSVLVTHDHADAAQVLREVQYLSDHPAESYAVPQERARRFFSQHSDNFDEVQREYSEQLAKDLERLRQLMGPGVNLTLWLADGAGGLVRWVSHDRIFTRSDELLTIDAGWDSDWIAGEAAASDELIVRVVDEPGRHRWRSVVAAPLSVDVPGGPPFTAAVLSSATPRDLEALEPEDLDEWRTVVQRIAAEWEARLAEKAQGPSPWDELE